LDLRISPGGRLTVTNLQLIDLIVQAYGVQAYQIEGAPAWVRQDRFDIVATAQGNPDRDGMMQRLRTLLEERFKLKVRREIREGNVFALTVASGGPKLARASELKEGERPRMGSGRTGSPTAPALSYYKQGRYASIALLASSLETELRRPVIDKTGITGAFDFKFEYAADETKTSDFPVLTTAIQESLGLRLVSAKGPVTVLVVEDVQRPTEN
jgi:uncharacterized protein (TIGR03435 family)